MDITVYMKWDEEASVWVAYCDGNGFALESGSYDALVERVKSALPDYLEHTCKSITFLTKERRVLCA